MLCCVVSIARLCMAAADVVKERGRETESERDRERRSERETGRESELCGKLS